MKALFQYLSGGFISVWLLGLGLGLVFSYLGVFYQALTNDEKE